MTVKMATFTITHTRFLKWLLQKATALECTKYDNQMRYQIDLQNTIWNTQDQINSLANLME